MLGPTRPQAHGESACSGGHLGKEARGGSQGGGDTGPGSQASQVPCLVPARGLPHRKPAPPAALRSQMTTTGVSHLLAALGHSGRRIVLGPT